MSQLFAVVAKARPQLHCFGHIHEAWSARIARWPSITGEQPPAEALYDKLTYRRNEKEEEQGRQWWREVLREEQRKGPGGCCLVDLTRGKHALNVGAETLFINAAVVDQFNRPSRPPWVVDLLLRPSSRDREPPEPPKS